MAFPRVWRAWIVILMMPVRPEARSVRHVTPTAITSLELNAEDEPGTGPSFMITGSFGRYSVENTHDHELEQPHGPVRDGHAWPGPVLLVRRASGTLP
jgi:hypothetical protein